jgi:nitrite reductase/ring-hydroxylating ferredoxin subunit
MSHDAAHEKECGDCPIAAAGRRAVLRNAALAVAGALALGATAREALAERVAEATASLRRGLLRAYALPGEGTVSVDAANDLVLARWDNRVYAFSLKCPHRGTRLEWQAAERTLFCPKHKARFAPDGAHLSGRQSRDLDRYDIKREGSSVVVDLGALRRADQDGERWRTAVVAVMS